MEKSNRRLLFALGALLLALLSWLAMQMTWKVEEIDLGYSAEAQKDSFLAAKRLLQQQGVTGHTLRSFSILDNLRWQDQALTANDTLILFNAHKMLRGERLNNLLSWVESGGTVIVSTANPFMGETTRTDDPLLELFDIRLVEASPDEDEGSEDESPTWLDELEEYDDDITEDSAARDEASAEDNVIPDENISAEGDEAALDDDEAVSGSASACPAPAAEDGAKDENLSDHYSRCNLGSLPLAVEFFNEADPLLIDYSEGRAFETLGDEPQGAASDDRGLHLAQFEWGAGLVIINSDNQIWENERIDCHDHAYALWQLINQQGQVWFLVNQEAPSLWTLLWRATPYGAVALLLALALWLWAKASRFGPILTRASNQRRSLGEHIHASAMLLWRRQQHPHLVTLLRDDIRQQLQQHYPQFATWSEQEQIAHLQTLTNLSVSQVHQALFSEKLQYPQDFTEAVACLQTIRKSV